MKQIFEMETLSMAQSNAYTGLNDKKKKPRKKVYTSLPRHLKEEPHKVSFGCGTLPSDNMNMVMTHEFEHAYVHKLK